MKIKYCTECWGTGHVPDFWDNDKEVICPHCNGTGKEPKSPPQTNDEWRKTCSTEEFAKLLYDAMLYGQQCDKDDVTCEECGCPWCKTDSISEWLKQPHNHTPQKQDDYPCNVKGCKMETRQACCGCPDYFKWKERQESR